MDTATLLDPVKLFKATAQFLMFLHSWMVRVILTKEAACCDKVWVIVTLPRVAGLGLFGLAVDICHGARHLGDHHLDSGGIECVRFISL